MTAAPVDPKPCRCNGECFALIRARAGNDWVIECDECGGVPIDGWAKVAAIAARFGGAK